MRLQEFRKKYPQYNDVPDKQLADGLYEKFYASAITKDDFYSQIGLTPAEPFAQPEPITGMESAFAPTAPTEGPKRKRSVMEGYKAEPTPLIQAMGAPVSRGEYDKIRSLYDISTPEERLELMGRDDYVGSVARAIDEEYRRFKPAAPSTKSLDPRREARAEELIRQGADYQVAQLRAKQEMELGLPPAPLAVAQETPPETTEAIETRKLLATEGILARAGVRGVTGIKQGFAGAAEAVTDLTGDTEASKYYERIGRQSDTFLKQLGDPKGSTLAAGFEGAVNSIVQQAPGLVLGVLGGSAPALMYMGNLVFGQEYSAGKRAELSPQEAAARAGLMAAAEVVFERYGLGETLAGIRAAAKGVPTSKLAEYFGKAIAKEVPAEMATTTAQFGVETTPGIGLTPDATATDLVKQLADTVIQTILQTGTLGGASFVASEARKVIPKIGAGERNVTIPPSQRPSPTISGEGIPISGRPERTLAPEGFAGAEPPPVGVPSVPAVEPVQGEGAPPPALDVRKEIDTLLDEYATVDPVAAGEFRTLFVDPNATYTQDDVDIVREIVNDARKLKEEETPQGAVEKPLAKTNEFITDKNGEPLVLYRGIQGDKEGAINAEPREGYNVFASDNPDVAATYGMPDAFGTPGSIVPIYVKAGKLIEFPVTVDRYGSRSFDKVEFDRRAKSLAPGEVLVARQVVDIGPMASEAYQVDKEKKYSYYSDVYALGRGTPVESAVGKTKPKKETPSAVTPTEAQQAKEEGAAAPAEGTEVAEPTAAAKTADQLQDEIRDLEQQRLALLTKNGRVPAVKSKARAKYDALGEQVDALMGQWDKTDRAERAAKKPALAQAKLQELDTGKRTIEQVKQERNALLAEQQTLRTATGKPPAVRSPARRKYDALTERINQLYDEELKLTPKEPTKVEEVTTKDLQDRVANIKATIAETEAELAAATEDGNIEALENKLDALEKDLKNAQFDLREKIEAQREEGLDFFDITGATDVSDKGGTAPVSLRRTIRRLRKALNEDQIDSDTYAAEVNAAYDETSKEGKAPADLVRGQLNIRERLLRAVRNGQLPEESLELAEWFIKQNPALVDDLAISIRSPKEGEDNIAGQYVQFRRLMRLIAGSTKKDTVIHEIMHHLERMMPENVQSAIRELWLKSLIDAKNRAAYGSPKRKYLELVHKALLYNDKKAYEEAYKMLVDGQVFYNVYQYLNPSEFWAVNASRILEGKFNAPKTIISRLKQWLKGLVATLKDKLGLPSDAPIIRALDSLIKSDGKFKSKQMLATSVSRFYMFAGKKALEESEYDPIAVADDKARKLANLQEAEKMEKAGASPVEVWNKTGWLHDQADGQWRFEVDDSTAKFDANKWATVPTASVFYNKGNVPEDQRTTLGEILDHPKLYAAYPDLKNIIVFKRPSFFDFFNQTQGYYTVSEDSITITPYAIDPERTLVHEIQHAIQIKEGFGPGASSEAISLNNVDNLEKLKERYENDPKINTSKGAELSKKIQVVDNLIGLQFELGKRIALKNKIEKELNSVVKNELHPASEEYKYILFEVKKFGWFISATNEITKLQLHKKAIRDDLDRLYSKRRTILHLPFADYERNANELKNLENEIKYRRVDEAILYEQIDAKRADLSNRVKTETENAKTAKDEATKKVDELKNKLKDASKKIDDLVASVRQGPYGASDIKYDLYLMASGEIEARNTAARLRLSAEERQRTPPSVTADIEAAYAILMGEPGVSAQSLPPGQQPPVRSLNPPGTVVNQSPQFPKPSPPGVLPGTNVPLNQPPPTPPGGQPPIVAGRKRPRGPRGPISGKSPWRTAEDATKTLTGVLNDALKGRTPWGKAVGSLAPAIWNPINSKLRRAFLFSATLRQLADITRFKFPQLVTAINIVDKMTSFRLGKLGEAQMIAKDWLDAQNKKPAQSTLAGRIMLDATINGKDPDKGPTGIAKLDAAWASLDPEFQAIYRRVRDYFYNNLQEMIREMKKRVLKLPKAERQAAIRKINEQFAPDKLVFPYFPLRRFGEYWFQVGKGNFKEFYEFESEVTRELSRAARIRELKSGNAQQKALAETVDFGAGISELFSKNLASTQILKEVQDLIDSIVPPTGATSTKSAQDVRKELQDSLNQLIYIMLPQQSMRKMFINRKAVQGASSDMLRVFTDVAVHSAYQMARFKYGEDFINNINKARDYINEFFKPDARAVYRDFVNELEARTKTVLSAEDKSFLAKAAGTAGTFVFFSMLSAPFTALLNTLGFAVFTGSKLGGKYGYTEASEVMLKNMGRYWQTAPGRMLKPAAKGLIFQMKFPSIVEGGKLSPLLQRAADRFIAEEQVNVSLTNDIFDLTERPSELYTTRYNILKKILGGLFHQSERANREVALMSAFELEYNRLLNSPKRDTRGVIERDANGNPVTYTPDEAFEGAIQEAKHIAGLTLGDFSRQMKSRLFANVPLSVLLKFKQYAFMATYNYMRALQLSLSPLFDKKELNDIRKVFVDEKLSQAEIDQRMKDIKKFRRDIAKQSGKELLGILGVTFLFGGLEAMPFFWIVLPAMFLMLASDDDKEDEESNYLNWFRNWADERLGGMSLARGPISQLIGGSLSERVSLDPLNTFYRDGRYSPDVVEGLIQDVIANAGPVVGLAMNWAEAAKLFGEGQYSRAWEKILPALFAKPIQAYRYGTEGATTRSGEEQLAAEKFSEWMLVMQAVGLQPEELALKQKSAIQAKEKEQKILAKETGLLNRLWLERDNAKGFDTALDKALQFYEKYPDMLPEDGDFSEKLMTSFEVRAEQIAEAEAFGARIDKRLRERIAPMLEYGQPKPKPPERMTLEEVRQKYPQYNDVPDKELSDALKAKGLLK